MALKRDAIHYACSIALAAGLASLCRSASFAAGRPLAIVLAAGDVAGCDARNLERAAATAGLLAREIDAARASKIPVKVTLLGDLAYQNGTNKEFACFHETWGKVLNDRLANASADVLPVPGNHEYNTAGAKGFYRYFRSNKRIGPEGRAYYQLTFPKGAAGAWRLFGLNSEIGGEPQSRQYRWLQGKLAASPERCVLSFWHRPVFSSGKHGHGDDGYFPAETPVKQDEMSDIEALLSETGASIVLNGHDHDYEELDPHDETGRPAPDGLRAFVVGTGGRELYDRHGKTWPAISRNYDTSTYGILKLMLYPGRYSWSFLATGNGGAKYTGKGVCNSRKTQSQ